MGLGPCPEGRGAASAEPRDYVRALATNFFTHRFRPVTPSPAHVRNAPGEPGDGKDREDKGSSGMIFRTYGDRRLIIALVAATALAAAVAVPLSSAGAASGARSALPGHGRSPERYTIGLFGDMPYGALGRSQYPNLLANINDNHVAFSIFDGDLQAGGDGPCNDSLYTTARANFNTLQRPLIWLPGDNDWTDCWGRYGPAQAPYHDPIERLNFERQLFDSTSQSLGRKTLTLTRESSEGGPGGALEAGTSVGPGPHQISCRPDRRSGVVRRHDLPVGRQSGRHRLSHSCQTFRNVLLTATFPSRIR
jgi:hypothetical protein